MEQGAEDEILRRAKNSEVALLVVGDPFGATTHADLALRAQELGIEVKVLLYFFLKKTSKLLKTHF